jgi:hypothetical protein
MIRFRIGRAIGFALVGLFIAAAGPTPLGWVAVAWWLL